MQPMGIGTIIDNTFKIYRKHFAAIAIFALVISGGINLIITSIGQGPDVFSLSQSLFTDMQGSLTGGDMAFEDILATLGDEYSTYFANAALASFLGLLASILVTPFVTGGITGITLAAAHGQQDTPGNWISRTLSVYGGLIGTALAVIVMSIVLAIVFAIAFVILIFIMVFLIDLSGLFLILLVPVFIVAVLLAVGIACFLHLVYPAAIQEKAFGFRAVGRAWSLFRGRFWKTVGLIFLIGIIVGILGLIVGAITAFLPMFLMNLVNTAVSALLAPVSLIAVSLLYLDIRVTKEGYDLELRAKGALPADGSDASH